MISGNRKLLEDLLYRVRSHGAAADAAPRDAAARAMSAQRVRERGALSGRSAAACRSSSPRTTKRTSIGEVVARSARPPRLARDHRRRRRIDAMAPARAAAAAGADRGAASVQQGQRRGGEERNPPRDRRVRPDRRRRRPAPPEDAVRLVVAARRVRPGHRRALGDDAGDAGAARSATRALNWLASYLTGPRDPGPDVRVPRRAARRACASSSTCCRTGSRRRRRPRWRSSRRGTTSRSSRSRRGSASGNRRSGSRATARSS